LSDFDRTHVFSSSLVYNLPTLDGRNGFVKGAVGGWETSTVVSLATGNALTITGALGGTPGTCLTPYSGTCPQTSPADPWGVVGNGAFTNFSVRPLLTGQSCYTGDNSQFINPAAFTMNGYVIGQAPQSGIGQCHGPGIADVDFSLDKNWSLKEMHLGESAYLQFRLEFFNLFNHPMFRYGAASADSNTNLHYVASGGYIDKNGVVQGTKLTTGSPFGNTPFLSNLGNREIQYALKLVF
jgi:hypothetical protein